MIQRALIFATVIIALISCNKDKHDRNTTCSQDGLTNVPNISGGQICTDEICETYTVMWKELIMEKNNLSQEFMDTYVEIIDSEINSWDSGLSFNICYNYTSDWASAYHCDHFIIKVDADDTTFPSLAIPRDQYLTKDEVRLVTDNLAFSSFITRITNSNHLLYVSLEEAMLDLTKHADVTQLCMKSISIDEDHGNLVLEAWAEYEGKDNKCIKATVDLMTGDKTAEDISCYMQ